MLFSPYKFQRSEFPVVSSRIMVLLVFNDEVQTYIENVMSFDEIFKTGSKGWLRKLNKLMFFPGFLYALDLEAVFPLLFQCDLKKKIRCRFSFHFLILSSNVLPVALTATAYISSEIDRMAD